MQILILENYEIKEVQILSRNFYALFLKTLRKHRHLQENTYSAISFAKLFNSFKENAAFNVHILSLIIHIYICIFKRQTTNNIIFCCIIFHILFE